MGAYVPDIEQIVTDIANFLSAEYGVHAVGGDTTLEEIFEDAHIDIEDEQEVREFFKALEEELEVAGLAENADKFNDVSAIASNIQDQYEEVSEGIDREIKNDTTKVRQNKKAAMQQSAAAAEQGEAGTEAEVAEPAAKPAVAGEHGGGGNHTGRTTGRRRVSAASKVR